MKNDKNLRVVVLKETFGIPTAKADGQDCPMAYPSLVCM